MNFKNIEKFIINILVICAISGITIVFTNIIWNCVNPVEPIEKVITILGSILTLWIVIYLLNK